jgi:membrane protease YdiL (CAAX protease family)
VSQPYPTLPHWGEPLPASPPPHEVPRQYQELLRTRAYRPWKPAVGLIVFFVAYGALTLGVIFTCVVVDMYLTGKSYEDVTSGLLTDITPLGLLTVNLSLAAMIPAAMLAIVAVHHLSPGWLGSVIGHLRWRLLGRFLVLAGGVVLLVTFVAGFLPSDGVVTDSVQIVSFERWLSLAIVIVLTTPLQAAGEEYGFRGYALQALGAWFRNPRVGIIVTSLVFAAAHGGQNPPLFIARLGFGLVAGWLVIRTGGLEAAIALHVMNNLITFLVAAAFDQVDDALTTSEAPLWLALLDVGQAVLFASLVMWTVRRRPDAVQVPTPSSRAYP